MSRPRPRPASAPSRPWLIRAVVVAAVLVVVAALAVTLATGTLFTAPGGS